MPDCLFCRIAADEIEIEPLYEDHEIIAFADISPQAPSHLLFIPKQHFADVTKVPAELLGHLLHQAATYAAKTLPGGYRIVINTGDHGGQTVMHLHLHVLGGRPLGWPPG